MEVRSGNFLTETWSLVTQIRSVAQEKGLGHVLRIGLDWLATPLLARAHRWARRKRRFQVAGREYSYFTHRYNATWRNERAVELPVIREAVESARGNRILEIGNVLSHYMPVHHDVLDKYEQASGTVRADLVDFVPEHPYDLVVSISTIEHIGWDESPREPAKVLRALETMKRCLAPGGALLVTFPLGHNPFLDEQVRTGQIVFEEQHVLRRVSLANEWREVELGDVADAKYGHPYPYANAIVIGRFVRMPARENAAPGSGV